MSRVFYGNKSTEYNFEHFKQFQLPSSSKKSTESTRTAPATATAAPSSHPPPTAAASSGDDVDVMTQEKLAMLLDREETYNDFLVNRFGHDMVGWLEMVEVFEVISGFASV